MVVLLATSCASVVGTVNNGVYQVVERKSSYSVRVGVELLYDGGAAFRTQVEFCVIAVRTRVPSAPVALVVCSFVVVSVNVTKHCACDSNSIRNSDSSGIIMLIVIVLINTDSMSKRHTYSSSKVHNN